MTLSEQVEADLRNGGITLDGCAVLSDARLAGPGSIIVVRGDGKRVRLDGVPAGQQASATTIVNSLDLTPGGQATADTAKQRTDASTAVVANGLFYRIIRGIAALFVDGPTGQLNVLRAQVIGVATFVLDPPSIANAAGFTSPNVAVAGAAFGDLVDVAAPYSLAGLCATAYVSAAGQVVVRLNNLTGLAVNLASGTWNVVVRRHVLMPALTMPQALTAIQGKTNSAVTD